MLLTADWRKHLKEVTALITSPLQHRDAHMMYEQSSHAYVNRESAAALRPSECKKKKKKKLPVEVFMFSVRGNEREFSIIHVEAVRRLELLFLRAPSLRLSDRKEAECFTRLVCLSSASQAACLAHKNAGKTPSSAPPPPLPPPPPPPPDTSQLRGDFH